MINKGCRGQALVELAIFGSAALLLASVLIQVGVASNSGDANMMKAFRNALYVAKQRSLVVGDDNNPPPSPSTSVVFYDDRFSPQPASFGSASTVPVQAGYSDIVWSHKLNITSRGQSRRALTGLDFISQNGAGQGVQTWERVNGSANRNEAIQNGPGYTTQGWRTVPACTEVGQCRKLESKGGNGDWFEWKDVTQDEIYVGESLDVNGDNIEDYVTDINRVCETTVDDQGYVVDTTCVVVGMTIMTPAAGEINTQAVVRTVAYKDQYGVDKSAKIYQGVDPEYTKVGRSHSTATRVDSPGLVSSRTSLQNSDEVRRHINANAGARDMIDRPTQNVSISYDSNL